MIKDKTGLIEDYKRLEKIFFDRCKELKKTEKVVRKLAKKISNLGVDVGEITGVDDVADFENCNKLNEGEDACENDESRNFEISIQECGDLENGDMKNLNIEDMVQTLDSLESVDGEKTRGVDDEKFKNKDNENFKNLDNVNLSCNNNGSEEFLSGVFESKPVDEKQSIEEYLRYLVKRSGDQPAFLRGGGQKIVYQKRQTPPNNLKSAGEFVLKNYFK